MFGATKYINTHFFLLTNITQVKLKQLERTQTEGNLSSTITDGKEKIVNRKQTLTIFARAYLHML